MLRISTLLLVATLAGCGPSSPVEKVSEKEAAKTPAVPSKAAIPDPAKPWSSKDASGHDWAAQMGGIQFDTDWQGAMARAKASKTPLLFLFTEKQSADGEKMAAAVFKDPKVVEATKAFVVTIVDVDANEPLAERFNARTTPMVVYASPTGEILGSTISAPDMLGDIKSALDALKGDEDDK
jgi:hypothetical protein